MNIAGAMGAVKSLSPTRHPPPPKFRGREHTFLSPKRFISGFPKREGKEGQNGPLVSGVLSLSLHTLLVPLREARSGRGLSLAVVVDEAIVGLVAASSIVEVISELRASSSPRNTPGKASTLLIWLG